MEKILETLLSDPMYVGIAVLLGILFVVSLLKQVVRVALLCVVGLVVLALYLDATGKQESADKIREALVDKSSELSESLKDKLNEGSEQAVDVIRDAIEGEAADAVGGAGQLQADGVTQHGLRPPRGGRAAPGAACGPGGAVPWPPIR